MWKGGKRDEMKNDSKEREEERRLTAEKRRNWRKDRKTGSED